MLAPFFSESINRDLLPTAGGIYAGKRQEIDHAKALRRPIVSRQRW
jgi:hypothetical protein